MEVFWIVSGMANDDGDETMGTIYININIYIYIYIKKKISLFLPLLSSLFSHSSINIKNLKQNLFLLEIYNSSI